MCIFKGNIYALDSRLSRRILNLSIFIIHLLKAFGYSIINLTEPKSTIEEIIMSICKKCGYHSTEGDNRTTEKIIAKKALYVMFYSLSKASFHIFAKIFDIHSSLVYR